MERSKLQQVLAICHPDGHAQEDLDRLGVPVDAELKTHQISQSDYTDPSRAKISTLGSRKDIYSDYPQVSGEGPQHPVGAASNKLLYSPKERHCADHSMENNLNTYSHTISLLPRYKRRAIFRLALGIHLGVNRRRQTRGPVLSQEL